VAKCLGITMPKLTSDENGLAVLDVVLGEPDGLFLVRTDGHAPRLLGDDARLV